MPVVPLSITDVLCLVKLAATYSIAFVLFLPTFVLDLFNSSAVHYALYRSAWPYRYLFIVQYCLKNIVAYWTDWINHMVGNHYGGTIAEYSVWKKKGQEEAELEIHVCGDPESSLFNVLKQTHRGKMYCHTSRCDASNYAARYFFYTPHGMICAVRHSRCGGGSLRSPDRIIGHYFTTHEEVVNLFKCNSWLDYEWIFTTDIGVAQKFSNSYRA